VQRAIALLLAAAAFTLGLISSGGAGTDQVPRVTIARPTLPPITLPLPKPTPPPPGFPVSAGPILFVSTRDGAPELYKMQPSGEVQTRLTTAIGRVADPTLSETRLVYAAQTGAGWELYSTSASGSLGLTQLTRDGRQARSPRFLSDNVLVFVSNRSGNDDIWRLDLTTKQLTNLTGSSHGADIDPAPSPDGKRLAYASSHNGRFDVFVLTLSTGEVIQLTQAGESNFNPSWSPDGERIAFDRLKGGNYDIWLVNADGTGARPLVATPADESDPSYAPAPIAGKARLAFVTNTNGNYEIWGVNEDGSAAYDLTQSFGGDDLAPFWSAEPRIAMLVTQPPQTLPGGGGPFRPEQCTITAKPGQHRIVGTSHRDVICGSNGADTIEGRGGNDVIIPGRGKDTVIAGTGDDLVQARGGGIDSVAGGPGFDIGYTDRVDHRQGIDHPP
jgi:Tol biopolymer transport system component